MCNPTKINLISINRVNENYRKYHKQHIRYFLANKHLNILILILNKDIAHLKMKLVNFKAQISY